MALLELHDVHFSFDGEHEVLAGVSLALEPGVTTAVVGPNGAGKTTLLRVAGGVLTPSHGQVLLRGAPLQGLARRSAARVLAAVPAEQGAVFPFTVRETVTLGRHPWRGTFASLSQTDRECVDRALASTALDDLAERALPALSSGERQRAAIARCLAQDAEVHLLDEPTAHLDLGQRLRMLQLFRRRAREDGSAVLAVLHDLNLAAQVADRVVLLVAGRIEVAGPPAEVLTAERVETAFGIRVHVMPHPDRGAPVIVPADEGATP